jgi:hypothetical protein
MNLIRLRKILHFTLLHRDGAHGSHDDFFNENHFGGAETTQPRPNGKPHPDAISQDMRFSVAVKSRPLTI